MSQDRVALSEAQLERLYVKLEKPLYNVVYRWVWNASDAQDVTQEAFLKLWNMRARVQMETVEPLVYRIALNLASNRRRARRIWQWVGVDALASAPSRDHGGHAVLDKERDAQVREAIDGLPEPLRRVVVLCELGGMSYAQVAETLSIAEGTVGSRRNQAFKLLRLKLGAFMDEEDAHDAP